MRQTCRCVNEENYIYIIQMKRICDIICSVCILFIREAQMLIEIAADLPSSLLIVEVEWKTRA